MEKLTGKQILEKLSEAKISYEAIAYMDYDSEELGLGPVEEVDQYGGEGQGEEWYSVQYFKDHGVYIQIDGYYQSHYGCDFDNAPYEVEPKEVTVTKYVSKK